MECANAMLYSTSSSLVHYKLSSARRGSQAGAESAASVRQAEIPQGHTEFAH